MWFDYFEGNVNKFNLNNYVEIPTHNKRGVIMGIEYIRSNRYNPKKQGFWYKIAINTESVPHWHHEDSIKDIPF